jgi:DNA-binding LacI/PurR family transcriptional regulator
VSVSGSITVKDVARRAAVSVGTVSRVFHNHSNVTEEIRVRVLQAAEELGYKKAVIQESPQSRNRILKEIGFLYCSFVDDTAATSNPFWSHILRGVEREADRANIKLTYKAISNLASTPRELAGAIQDMKLDGILLVGPAERETSEMFAQTGFPLVLVDNHVPGLSVDSVLCDNFEGARLAVSYLIEQGHQHIAFIGGPVREGPRPLNKIYTLERRSAGYRTALLDAGLPVDYRLFETSHLDPQSGYEACQRLLARETEMSAIFCANDEIALGAMKALQEAGRRIPQDVSLVGFDDIALVAHLNPALSTVRVNKDALGVMAVKSLQMRASDPQMPGVSYVLEVELMKRNSVGSAPSRA